ncbi:MAG: hypothetical protein IJU81_06185 [Bacteroidales bacterium]|nr:hypothetical protein [Bacteroidales bacterium]
MKRIIPLIILLALCSSLCAQKLITYESGMGTRDKDNPQVWILYQKVRAEHEGMVLYADSAILNNERNDFTAFRNIKIILTDTTVVYGNRLYYDGETRVLRIWADTVVLIDGHTTLKSDNLQYNRKTETGTYTNWGHATNGYRTLDSREGNYNSAFDEFYIYDNVILRDTGSTLYTDTLIYNTQTERADFISPTRIYSDSTVIYSSEGTYYSGSRYAVSRRDSRVVSGAKELICDTLHHSEQTNHSRAIGNVRITDSLNNIVCLGGYGESNQESRLSLVTDSALVRQVDKGDTMYVHADTIFVYTDEEQQFSAMRASHHAKLFRRDMQAMSDSVYYSATDSLISLYYNPVLWHDSQQSTADSIKVYLDSNRIKLAKLQGASLSAERVDSLKFNQLAGDSTLVYFEQGKARYADVMSNARMVYYVTEQAENNIQMLIGVNVGQGDRIRIYFDNEGADKVVTYGKPDMYTYPLAKLPDDKRHLKGFQWYSQQRPLKWQDVYKW